MTSVFSVLPEDIVSRIISFTSPKDACRSSAVSQRFKSASESDTVWERFLPKDYQEIISNCVAPIHYATKKELFCHLCRSPVLLNGGTLSFWLSKSSGKKCYMICARELSIAWKDSPRHWNWTSKVNSRFSEVAELLMVRRLDIQGKMQTKMLSPDIYYRAYLVFKITDNSYGLDCVKTASVKFSHKSRRSVCDNVFLTRTVCTDQLCGTRCLMVGECTHGRFPKMRNDGWMEIYLGIFFNNEGDSEIEMELYEILMNHWKGGLIIEGIELRPLGR